MNRYPIQVAKVQCPALRDETLARDRLLDWLNARIHDRVILVLADAGYGKTTLLADFSRRTRFRTLWYRFEEDDRDWIAVLNHLVAAGREHDPGFAPTTASLLAETSVGGPTREAVIDVFLRELQSITQPGAVLILDDFHVADDSPDVRLIVRELVARAPERLTIVFSSRRPPTVPLARLRASGEVSEIGTDDLRFDAAETRRLFNETYGRPLEADVLADVVARTEGWAASLHLVQQALRDRSPSDIRHFVRGLTGADHELYEYLAEEVVGDLPADLQQFLMRTSILETVTPELAAVVSETTAAETARLTLAAERLTLLTSRARSQNGPRRYHPLVREFLEERLRQSFGDATVAALDRKVAEVAVSSDWRLAAHHYRRAGDSDLVELVIAQSIPQIMGSGQYRIANDLIETQPIGRGLVSLNLLRARVQMQTGNTDDAAALSEAVLRDSAAGSTASDHALLNLMTLHMYSGRPDAVIDVAERLRESTVNSDLLGVAVATRAMIDAGRSGSLAFLADRLRDVADRHRGREPHYHGVAMLNLAFTAILQDEPAVAVQYADEAIDALSQTSSKIELSAALMTKATSMTLLGEASTAEVAAKAAAELGQVEAVLERADIADSFQDPDAAGALLERADLGAALSSIDACALSMQRARFHARRGRFQEAWTTISEIDAEMDGVVVGQRTHRLATEAYVATSASSPDRLDLVRVALAAARAQGATRWWRILKLLEADREKQGALSEAVQTVGPDSPWSLTYVADILAGSLHELDESALSCVASAATLHPGRWRYVLRNQVDHHQEQASALVAARLLEQIGERSDIQRLRTFARRNRRLPRASRLGMDLARKLADHVFVEDQNRVSVAVGRRTVPGSAIRRKVLALLCFLLTKSDFAATREQVLDALWPDLAPADAVNSLNQTVYFLRRVFEETYVDDLSPGYLHHDSDLIWLDRDLVASRSNDCRRLIKALPEMPSPEEVQSLADLYVGRFALDFEYEEWSTPYREWLHASFLEVVEKSVTNDVETGHFNRGIRLARRVLDVDPDADQVEATLLRLYRASGAHAAAAEQYAHYAAYLRDELGVDPPPLESFR